MRAVRRAWLLLCWLRLPLAIRLPNGTEPQCHGDGAELRRVQEIEHAEQELWENFQQMQQEGAFAQVNPQSLRLNGEQWCRSGLPSKALQSRVAMILVGQPFRARNYLAYAEARGSCSEGTVPVQQKLVQNHLDMVVKPIETQLGMQVDIFLTDTPCSQVMLHQKRNYQAMNTSLDSLGLLKQWYGPQRVKGVSRGAVEDTMYDRMAGMFGTAAKYMQGQNGVYEYFMVSRYDLYFDKPFTSLLTQQHGALSFTYAHDFFFAFPREMFGCMQGIFTDCLAQIEFKPGRGSDQDRQEQGCYTFGPLQLPHWHGGFGYILLMMALQASLKQAAPKLVGPRLLQKTGCSAFDISGHEHRCTGGWYWPPRHSYEDRLMPCYFHVG